MLQVRTVELITASRRESRNKLGASSWVEKQLNAAKSLSNDSGEQWTFLFHVMDDPRIPIHRRLAFLRALYSDAVNWSRCEVLAENTAAYIGKVLECAGAVRSRGVFPTELEVGRACRELFKFYDEDDHCNPLVPRGLFGAMTIQPIGPGQIAA